MSEKVVQLRAQREQSAIAMKHMDDYRQQLREQVRLADAALLLQNSYEDILYIQNY